MQIHKTAVLSAATKDITRAVRCLERKFGINNALPVTLKLAAALDKLAEMRNQEALNEPSWSAA
jgi:hypothetical protein